MLDWSTVFAFLLGFATATILIAGFGFFWLKRRWQSILFGLGAKLFGKGVAHVQNRRAERNATDGMGGKINGSFREVGRQ